MVILKRQRGAVLIISLLLLVAITLLGVSAINSSTVNLMVVGNLQAQQDAEAQTQEAIEAVISSATWFTNPAPAPFDVDVSDDQTVRILSVTCRNSEIAEGYSATMQLVPEVNTWQISARHADASTGQVVIHQGVRMRQPSDRCPS